MLRQLPSMLYLAESVTEALQIVHPNLEAFLCF